MDLMNKLASLAQRYEELNNLMGQSEVLSDIPLLQRYGREHAELEDWNQIVIHLALKTDLSPRVCVNRCRIQKVRSHVGIQSGKWSAGNGNCPRVRGCVE